MQNNLHEQEYKKLVERVLKEGQVRPDRTGTGILGIFGHFMSFDVSESIPLLTTKKINFSNILYETIWMFVKGSTNISYLKDNNVNIWNSWANSENELGPIYGKQARDYQGYRIVNDEVTLPNIDQISNLIEGLKTDPYSRRHIITLWNPATAPENSNNFSKLIEDGYSALPVCHGVVIQFYVSEGNRLSLQVYVRSNDVFLGLPYNLINYSLLLYMVANIVDMKPLNVNYMIGDVHIYKNHIDKIKEQMKRKPYKSPSLIINKKVKNFDDYKISDFSLINYQSHPTISAKVSV